MIEYVIENNPDDRILRRASNLLQQNGIIALPTDTSWVLAVNPSSKKAVDDLYRLKHVDHHKHFSLLCNSISQASNYAVISDAAYRQINKLVPGPYTFIFPPTKNLPKSIRDYRKDKEIGIRIPSSFLCQKLVEFCDVPLLTTSLSSFLIDSINSDNDYNDHDNNEEKDLIYIQKEREIYSYQIEDRLAHIVSMILDPGELNLLGASTVISYLKESPEIIRAGSGPYTNYVRAT